MIASRAPRRVISITAWARSSTSLNSWPTSSSASSSLGETMSGSARTPSRSGSPSVSTIVVTPRRLHVADQLGVDVGLHPSRQAAGEHAHARALGEVQELVVEQLELLRADGRPTLVDLGLQSGGRVEHGRVRARLLADADERVEDRLVVERLDDPGPGGPSGQTGGDHRLPQPLDHAGDVDSLAARASSPARRCGAGDPGEVRDLERLVERRVERDGDDHAGRGIIMLTSPNRSVSLEGQALGPEADRAGGGLRRRERAGPADRPAQRRSRRRTPGLEGVGVLNRGVAALRAWRPALPSLTAMSDSVSPGLIT